MSTLEDRLLAVIAGAGLPTPQREGRLIAGRRFRADFYWAGPKVAVECDGGTWAGGRHVTGAGHASDSEKLNLLQLAGWLVLRVNAAQIGSGDAVAWIAEALAQRGAIELEPKEEE